METLNNVIITNITDIITVFSPKGKVVNIKNRSTYGISFCIEGQIIYSHGGNEYISDPDHAIILPKGQSYSLYGSKRGLFPVINFDTDNFLCDTIRSFPISSAEPYIKDFEQMKSLSLFDKNRTKLISILYNIIHRLYTSCDTSSGILKPAIKYIENNYTRSDLSNTTLAVQCGISEVYFRKLFAEQYNTTPKQYIIDIRIDKAKQLLTDGILKINAISEQCGFSNPYHFCRVFKDKVGVTPTEYMKENRIFKI